MLHNAPLAQSSAADFDHVIDTNLKGSRHLAAAVLPHLAARSHLVFIASLAGLTGSFAYTAYCASKFGVRGLAEALSRTWHCDRSQDGGDISYVTQ